MSEATPPSYPYYLHLLVDSDNLKVKFHSGDYPEEFHYYCRLGELTDSQYKHLKKWLGRFQKTDRFVLDLTGKYINPLDGLSIYSMTRIKFKVAQITEQTSDKLKQLIDNGNDDFKHKLVMEREIVLGNVYSPYRVLYDVRRKAAFFSGRVIDDAKPCRTSITDGNSKLSNSSSPSPPSSTPTASRKSDKQKDPMCDMPFPEMCQKLLLSPLPDDGKSNEVWVIASELATQLDLEEGTLRSARSRKPNEKMTVRL